MNDNELSFYNEILNQLKKLQLENTSLKQKNIQHEYQEEKLKEEIIKLKKLAYKDELTNLANRRAVSNLDSDFEAVILGDLDLFKEINDAYGHDIGDKVLQETARILRENIREEDLAVRWGGEEFLILLKSCSEINAIKKANQIREQIEQSVSSPAITISFGIAVLNKGVTLQNTIRQADKALYYSKHYGRNTVTSYSQLEKENQKRKSYKKDYR